MGDKDKCPGCAKTAYPVEAVEVDGSKWHKTCFKCSDCRVSLSLGTFLAGPFSMSLYNNLSDVCYDKVRETIYWHLATSSTKSSKLSVLIGRAGRLSTKSHQVSKWFHALCHTWEHFEL